MGSSRGGERRSRWSRSRSRSRDRSRRSRSRDRRRSRSRSRSKDRVKPATAPVATTSAYDASLSAVQAMAALQQQQQQAQLMQQLQQRQLLAQQMLMQQAAQAAAAVTNMSHGGHGQSTSAAATADRKAREIYVGNLAIGVVTPDMLRELFNTILKTQVPDPVNQPPVCNVTIDPAAGRFAFVEFRTRELCDAAIQLDKLDLCGRQMNIGRPKGYVDSKVNMTSAATMGQAQMAIAAAFGQVPGMAAMPAMPPQFAMAAAAPPTMLPLGPTPIVLLENMVSCGTIRDEQERKEIIDDVLQEVAKCGPVLSWAVPMPPASVPDSEGCRVYIKYSSAVEAQKCKAIMDGRRFDENVVKATYVTDADFMRAEAGEWMVKGPAPPPLPAGMLAGMPGPMGPMINAVPRPMGPVPPAGAPGGLPMGMPAMAMPQAPGLVLPPNFSLPAGFSLGGLGQLPK